MAQNIEINYYNGSSYEVLYPKTLGSQVSGAVTSANQLATSRTIRTNLASTSTASFNGTANITPGVTGTLPVAYGGTGTTSLSSLASNLSPYMSSNGLKYSSGSFTGTGSDTAGKSGNIQYPSGYSTIVLVLVTNGGYAQAIGSGIWQLTYGASLCSISSNPTAFQGDNGVFNNQFTWRSSYCYVVAKNNGSNALANGKPWDQSGKTYYYAFIYQ